MSAIFCAAEGTEERAELEVQYDLVEHYEDRHHSIEPPLPHQAIQYRIEKAGLAPEGLLAIFGDLDTVHRVLEGKRGLTPEEIFALHRELKLPLDSLIERTGAASAVSQAAKKRLRRQSA